MSTDMHRLLARTLLPLVLLLASIALPGTARAQEGFSMGFGAGIGSGSFDDVDGRQSGWLLSTDAALHMEGISAGGWLGYFRTTQGRGQGWQSSSAQLALGYLDYAVWGESGMVINLRGAGGFGRIVRDEALDDAWDEKTISSGLTWGAGLGFLGGDSYDGMFGGNLLFLTHSGDVPSSALLLSLEMRIGG